MYKEKSLVCHLPDNPETTKSEDSKGYQANEPLSVNTIQLVELDLPIESNTEYTQIDQSYQLHKPHRSIRSYESKSTTGIIAPKLDVGNSVPDTVRQ
jgi:hypothetical protein